MFYPVQRRLSLTSKKTPHCWSLDGIDIDVNNSAFIDVQINIWKNQQGFIIFLSPTEKYRIDPKDLKMFSVKRSYDLLSDTDSDDESCHQLKKIIRKTSLPKEVVHVLDTKKDAKNDDNVNEKELGPDDDICAICMESFIRDYDTAVVQLPCKHMFHEHCIETWFDIHKTCATCRKQYGVKTGDMPPNGTMTVDTDDLNTLPGYEEVGTIIITYEFPNGIQGPQHPNPGKRYSSTKRVCYLPDNTDGRDILRMLEIAFDNRVMFTIGVSLTTLVEGIIWNGIHMKTSMTGGPNNYGYPDPTYLQRVRNELHQKGIH